VRGLLCFGCNRTLPYYKDSDWLSKAASYVARFEEDEHVPAAVVDSREAEILDLRAQGMTLQEIATRYSLSRQRVHQIVQGNK
jgi:DNA-binding NarL/FixJ family response regulator